jgi:hypothetical protein
MPRVSRTWQATTPELPAPITQTFVEASLIGAI